MTATPWPAAVTALVLYVAWLVTAFGLRAFVMRRRTGDAGFRPLSGRPGSAAWWGGVLFAAAIALGLAGAVAAVAGLPALPLLGHPGLAVLGLVTALAGALITIRAQGAMGAQWRVGVDPEERTGLVTHGLFGLARNPFFTGCLATAGGLALLAPNALTVAAVGLLLSAVETQVRRVEEPYLLGLHGDAYRRYAERTGRFVPGVGRGV